MSRAYNQPGGATPGTAHRIPVDPHKGLTAAEVQARTEAGAKNTAQDSGSATLGKILRRNILTLFNLINALLAVSVFLAGYPEQSLFIGVAFFNTTMGIIQELRAKRTLDKLSILTRGKARLVRDGKAGDYDPEDIVQDDILLLSAGDQIPVDAVLLRSEGLEVDESLLTGESDNIRKREGDPVLSGSFAVAGRGTAQVTAVGAHSYANMLSREAKKEKRRVTPLMRALQRIIRTLTVAIIPMGAFLFINQYRQSGDFATSLLGMTTGVIGMIPEGLIILTTLTLTVGALRLTKRKALVQALPCIETLARVDVLCLDKTGTITDGTLTFEGLTPCGTWREQDAADALRALLAALPDDNATAKALRAAFPSGGAGAVRHRATAIAPFSSLRKWSGASFEGWGSFVLGAPDILLSSREEGLRETVRQHAARGCRVLCIAHSEGLLRGTELPCGLSPVALLSLSDTVRPEAPEVFRYFANEGVALKVISGDDPLTVSHIAAKAGIDGAERAVDMRSVGEKPDYALLTRQYHVFGRVSPAQKRELIRALQQAGHTTCMTGDGVNDVLAMKEAGCSVAMMNGSSAARGAADFVLLTSNFAAMVDVLREGRKVINNIETVAALYLVKTIYSTLLTLLYSILPYPMPYTPLHITPVNALTVGLPSFLLALRPNYRRPGGKLVAGILTQSLPAALSVLCGVLYYQITSFFFDLDTRAVATLCALYIGAAMFSLLWRISRPHKHYIYVVFTVLALAFATCFAVFYDFFGYEGLFSRLIVYYLPMTLVAQRIYSSLHKLSRRLLGREQKRRNARFSRR